MLSERLEVPVVGAGSEEYPYRPKYSEAGGVLGYEYAEYDNSAVRADFKFENEAVRDSIVAESDVEVVS